MLVKFEVIKNGAYKIVYVKPEVRDYFVEKAKEFNVPIIKEKKVY